MHMYRNIILFPIEGIWKQRVICFLKRRGPDVFGPTDLRYMLNAFELYWLTVYRSVVQQVLVLRSNYAYLPGCSLLTYFFFAFFLRMNCTLLDKIHEIQRSRADQNLQSRFEKLSVRFALFVFFTAAKLSVFLVDFWHSHQTYSVTQTW